MKKKRGDLWSLAERVTKEIEEKRGYKEFSEDTLYWFFFEACARHTATPKTLCPKVLKNSVKLANGDMLFFKNGFQCTAPTRVNDVACDYWENRILARQEAYYD